MLPLLVWTLIATLIFFQGFHLQSRNVKVTYTIGDILSREEAPVSPSYLDNLHGLQNMMTSAADGRAALRVSLVKFSLNEVDGTGRYSVIWSEARGGRVVAHPTGAPEPRLEASLPVMFDGQSILVTETWVEYVPALYFGFLETREFAELMTTRPRGPQLCWNDSDDPSVWSEATNIC